MPAATPPPPKTVHLRIRRQDHPDRPASRRWETFAVPLVPGLTVHGCLDHIRTHPVTSRGDTVAPVAFEGACLEGICGDCTMRIDGQARLACSTQIEPLAAKGRTVVLEPLAKLPTQRDLIVDRGAVFDTFERVRAWTHREEPTLETPEEQELRYALGACIGCAACLDACPEYQPTRPFMGAAAINQARLFNLHGTAEERSRRLEILMGEGGVADCGKAQTCVEVCPQQIPLVESIGHMARDTTRQFLFGWLRGR